MNEFKVGDIVKNTSDYGAWGRMGIVSGLLTIPERGVERVKVMAPYEDSVRGRVLQEELWETSETRLAL